MFELRDNEPSYAQLNAPCVADSIAHDKPIDLIAEINAHGNPIDLIASSTVEAGTSMYINADAGIGDTQNRNKQHGFHFTADNCIGCHACEAACSEKNDLPAHVSFRSVGYVEGGSYPELTRMNISMACNHCDDPVCLKGCPTNAYSKHAEYGAVLQDPDTCFGCGYCTWVCPYNAPQLDPVEGHVQKCNMCVDRLEVGLKPACVSACVGNALDFGVIDSTPENRQEAKVNLPGFPDPEITQPNIRFEQLKDMPEEFSRPDSAPIKYKLDAETKTYQPTLDLSPNPETQWSLKKLNSRENPLVIFTLSTQAVIGAFSILLLGGMLGIGSMANLVSSNIAAPFMILLAALQAFVLFLSTQHLGKPWRFYRGFNNLRYSPLSREALAVAIFFGFLPLTAIALFLGTGFFGWLDGEAFRAAWLPWLSPDMLATGQNVLVLLAVPIGLSGLYFMHMIYRIKARPFWNHWQVLTSFFGNMLSLGAIIIGLFCVPLAWFSSVELGSLLIDLAPFVALGLLLEVIGHYCHFRDLTRWGREGAASLGILRSEFGKTHRARNITLLACLVISVLVSLAPTALVAPSAFMNILLAGVAIATLGAAIVSRALFYVLVIPTTMPGAFFWKNKGFEEHARETGLAKMPQVGVVEFDH